LRITDRNYILTDGKILAAGTGAEISSNEQVRKHYLGQQFDFNDGDDSSSNGGSKS